MMRRTPHVKRAVSNSLITVRARSARNQGVGKASLLTESTGQGRTTRARHAVSAINRLAQSTSLWVALVDSPGPMLADTAGPALCCASVVMTHALTAVWSPCLLCSNAEFDMQVQGTGYMSLSTAHQWIEAIGCPSWTGSLCPFAKQ
jgi:hypothetical protein